MTQKRLIIHSDEVETWFGNTDMPGCEEHLAIIALLRGQTDVLELRSHQNPSSAADLFELGDNVIVYGQSNGELGCVTQAIESLKKKA